MPTLKRLLRYALILALAGIVLGAAGLGIAYWLIAPRLPPIRTSRQQRHHRKKVTNASCQNKEMPNGMTIF